MQLFLHFFQFSTGFFLLLVLFYISSKLSEATPWCNGSTTGFGPVSLSSNLGGVAIFFAALPFLIRCKTGLVLLCLPPDQAQCIFTAPAFRQKKENGVFSFPFSSPRSYWEVWPERYSRTTRNIATTCPGTKKHSVSRHISSSVPHPTSRIPIMPRGGQSNPNNTLRISSPGVIIFSSLFIWLCSPHGQVFFFSKSLSGTFVFCLLQKRKC